MTSAHELTALLEEDFAAIERVIQAPTLPPTLNQVPLTTRPPVPRSQHLLPGSSLILITGLMGGWLASWLGAMQQSGVGHGS